MSKCQLLADISDTVVFRNNDGTCIGRFVSQNHAEKGGFAMAVAPHDTQTLPGIQAKADVRKQAQLAVAFADIFDSNHDLQKVSLLSLRVHRI